MIFARYSIHVSVSPWPMSFPRCRRTAATKLRFAGRNPAAIRACPTMLGSRMYPDPNSSSQKMYDRALASLPGGNTRTTVFMKPYPIYAARGEGCRVWDLDGNVYHRLHQQLHLADSRPRPSRADQGGDRATGAGLGVRPADRIRGRSRGTAGFAVAIGRAGQVCKFRHRSRDDGAEGGACAYRPPQDRQMRGRLSRLL